MTAVIFLAIITKLSSYYDRTAICEINKLLKENKENGLSKTTKEFQINFNKKADKTHNHTVNGNDQLIYT